MILIGIASSTSRTAVIAFATETWHMHFANLLGIFSGLVQPAVVSFIVQALFPNLIISYSKNIRKKKQFSEVLLKNNRIP